eukprot:CAMPEP_0113383566 /NCGR_PEP_ID=MMETSP0013_2-20120614/6423_1 /TAXON_ID=2843 ORGANISM="Skeletonema costatum, Strain 1716" /NCGR_SAMPLE_ID=MMETSP0013_2 /ASSEMBLY_ACC=CAM_ASM_000158 /LENGTH=145 /DNA_ID=CAMNT_0000266107 /DNA_START=159 /DNA_END=596 /DNA_ORIENTATION=- /assembly_acc=CAM_ASM_000158
MSTAAYLSTPKQSSAHLMDVMSSCPPPPRRVADIDSSVFVDNMCPAFPTLNTRNNGFFLAAPSSPHLLEHDDEDEEFLSFQIPMLKPRPSFKSRMAVPISTLKPRPAKPVSDVDMKMSPSLQNSYQLAMNKTGMRRSPSFHSPAA